jgi:hypothetical protein
LELLGDGKRKFISAVEIEKRSSRSKSILFRQLRSDFAAAPSLVRSKRPERTSRERVANVVCQKELIRGRSGVGKRHGCWCGSQRGNGELIYETTDVYRHHRQTDLYVLCSTR